MVVYVLKGRVRSWEEQALGEDFLGNWVEEEDSFLFFSGPQDRAVQSLLEGRPELRLVDRVAFSYEEWHGGALEPLRVGHFLITPFWVETPEDPDALHLRLDPGVVFGSGLHPTTRDSLRALEAAWETRPFRRVVDLGTGSGILGVAAGILGAERVLAVDLNPLCVKTAQRNAELNRVGDRMEVVEASFPTVLGESADLWVANLHAEAITSLLDQKNLIPGERLILSGLLRTPFRHIRERLLKQGLRVQREWEAEGTWHTLLVGCP